MPIIQKRADELKPGDVWLIRPASRYVVLAVIQEEPNGQVELTTCGVALGQEAGMRDRVTHEPSRLFEIEAPDLTLAQQHAEELADVIRLFLSARLRGVQNNTEGTVAVERMKEIMAIRINLWNG
jgi:hypothetical protein